ncbi:MAG: hypothetical protein ACK42E_05220 [Candidatus Bipolaricaulaceae bacterium]
MKLSELLTRRRARAFQFQAQREPEKAPRPAWATDIGPLDLYYGRQAWVLQPSADDFSWAYKSEKVSIPFLQGFDIDTLAIGQVRVPFLLRLENLDALLSVFAPAWQSPKAGESPSFSSHPLYAVYEKLWGSWDTPEGRTLRAMAGSLFFNQDESMTVFRNLLYNELRSRLGNYHKVLLDISPLLAMGEATVQERLAQLGKQAEVKLAEAYQEVAKHMREAWNEAAKKWFDLQAKARNTVKFYADQAIQTGKTVTTHTPPPNRTQYLPLPPGI